jgi:transposase
MPPNYVKAYVKRGKTDAIDAAAICEAVSVAEHVVRSGERPDQRGLSARPID